MGYRLGVRRDAARGSLESSRLGTVVPQVHAAKIPTLIIRTAV